jgi:hypothetical protein
MTGWLAVDGLVGTGAYLVPRVSIEDAGRMSRCDSTWHMSKNWRTGRFIIRLPYVVSQTHTDTHSIPPSPRYKDMSRSSKGKEKEHINEA